MYFNGLRRPLNTGPYLKLWDMYYWSSLSCTNNSNLTGSFLPAPFKILTKVYFLFWTSFCLYCSLANLFSSKPGDPWKVTFWAWNPSLFPKWVRTKKKSLPLQKWKKVPEPEGQYTKMKNMNNCQTDYSSPFCVSAESLVSSFSSQQFLICRIH